MEWKRKIWRNWEDSYQCVAEVVTANTVEDLRLVIEKARAEGKTIRVSGGGRPEAYSASFSGSPIVKNAENVIVRTPLLNRVWTLDDGSNRVTAEGGATLKELDAVLHRNRLSLLTSTAPNFITVAGAVALSCHGCGKHTGTLSDLVVGMTILDGEGRLVEIGEDDPELLRAARVNLGALGIIINVTFQCEPEFKLVATDTGKVSVREALDRAQHLYETHDYLEYFWYPFCDKVWVKTWDRVSGEVKNVKAPGRLEDFKQRMLGVTSDAILKVATNLPFFTPIMQKTLMAATPEQTMVAPAYEVFHYQNYFPRRLYDLSYAIDTGEDFSNFRSAFEFVTAKVCEYAKPKRSCTSPWGFEYKRGRQFVQNFIMHCRFIRNSDAFLAPAVGNHYTCMFEAVTYVGTPSKQYYEEVEAHWLALGGRPHWGKTYNPDLDFRALYGSNWDAFNRIRQRMDPEGLFLNDFTRHVFQVEKAGAVAPA
ncbi:MAG: FAD-binding protein [Acidobacteria bacterium]|nr:FAD-binding protein [Acidobacteriota bacterium]